MKILVTGITGFIGKHLTQALLEDSVEVFALLQKGTDNSFVNQYSQIKSIEYDGTIEEVLSFFQEHRFDGVIHLASVFLSQHKSKDINRLIEANVLFGAHLLEAATTTSVKWFINTGTFWQHYQDADYNPVNLYAATKQAFEDLAKYYYETSEICFVTLKLIDTYGPSDIRTKIFALWKKAAESGETLDMSPGDQLIDIVYVKDVINAYNLLVKHVEKNSQRLVSGDYFTVSSNNRISLRELAEIFQKVTKKELNINWGKRPYRNREVMIPWTEYKPVPGWKPRCSFEEGIPRMFSLDVEKND